MFLIIYTFYWGKNSNTLCKSEKKEFCFFFKLTLYQGLREVSVLSKLFFASEKDVWNIVVKRKRSSHLVDIIQSLHIPGRKRYELLKWQQECQGMGGRYKMLLNPFHTYMFRNSKELNTIN
jgi:hypothetical protein